MSNMLKFENDTWTMNNIFLMQLLKMNAELAVEYLSDEKVEDFDKATHCLAMLQVEHLHKTISMVDELFSEKRLKPKRKPKLKLVKSKPKPQ